MSAPRTFDDILDHAVDAIRSGGPLDGVLATYRQHAEELRPLLETVDALHPASAFLPPTTRLQANFAVVQGALGHATMAPSAPTAPRPWWQRRLTFATLSLPAGVFAFALLSAGGAAAATVAVTTDLPSRVAETVEQVTPSWSHAIIPGGDDGGELTQPAPGADGSPEAPAVASTATPVAAPSESNTTAIPPTAAGPDAPGPQTFAATGVIANIRGNTFELTVEGVLYKVQIDANTTVQGLLEEGASAGVQGELTGNDRLHATSVSITTPPAVSEPPQEDAAPSPQPEKPHTPPGQADKTKTPPGQAEKTKTPPGQGGANGNGGGNSNGNGNGNGGGNN